MEAESSVPASGDNTSGAVMSETWRGFLQSGYRALWIIRVSRRAPSERSESGGTKLISGRKTVSVTGS